MNVCKTCRSPDVALIDAALIHSVPYRTVSEKFGIGTGSLKRHAKEHIPVTLAKARDAEEELKADRLLSETLRDRRIVRELFSLAASSEPIAQDESVAIKAVKGDRSFSISASREARGYTELLLKASGEWQERQHIDLGGGIKVEQEEADSIRFLRECHPDLLPELIAWGKEQIEKERIR